MHTGLGTFDDYAVAALGLPKSADGSKPDGVVPSSHQAKGAAKAAEEGEAQTFSMGVTLPTVPARLVKRILSGEFVGELSQDALRAEFRRSTEGDEKPSKAKSVRPVADQDAWVASFAQYAGVVSRSYPEKAVALWGHLATVMSCHVRLVEELRRVAEAQLLVHGAG